MSATLIMESNSILLVYSVPETGINVFSILMKVVWVKIALTILVLKHYVTFGPSIALFGYLMRCNGKIEHEFRCNRSETLLNVNYRVCVLLFGTVNREIRGRSTMASRVEFTLTLFLRFWCKVEIY